MKEEISLSRTDAGVPVIVNHIPSARTAALAVYVRVGSRDEPKGREGLAHLLEHVMFKGTLNRSSKETSEIIEAAGGELNGYTGKESTCFYTVTLGETLPTAEEILSDLILNPLLGEDSVITERKVVSEEIRMLQDQPDTFIHHLFTRVLWDGHPIASSETGEAEAVSSLSGDDLRIFFRDMYRPRNFMVAACGSVRSSRVERWSSRTFDPLARGGSVNGRTPPTPRSRIEVFPRDGPQSYVGMGFPGLYAAHPDRYTQTLLSAILGAGTSSRLYQNVRERKGLVYSIYTMAQPFSDCGMLGVFFSTSAKNTQTVVDLVASELRGVKANGLERGELKRARQLMKGILVRRLESTESRMFHLGEFYLQTGKVPTEADLLEALEQVSEDDIMRVASEIMDRRKLGIALHGPEKALRQCAGRLESLDL